MSISAGEGGIKLGAELRSYGGTAQKSLQVQLRQAERMNTEHPCSRLSVEPGDGASPGQSGFRKP